jgi:hypothetical protein
MSIINGYGNPVVKLFDPRNPNAPKYTINLPLTNSDGLVESYQIRKITHELISPGLEAPAITNRQVILGYMISFTLHYNRFIKGEDLYNGIKKILDAAKAGWKMVLVPRADAQWREFDVLLANETLELGAFDLKKKNEISLNKVFSMEVTKELKDYPEKNLRKRKWFTFEEAVDKMDSVEIKNYLLKLKQDLKTANRNPS